MIRRWLAALRRWAYVDPDAAQRVIEIRADWGMGWEWGPDHDETPRR